MPESASCLRARCASGVVLMSWPPSTRSAKPRQRHADELVARRRAAGRRRELGRDRVQADGDGRADEPRAPTSQMPTRPCGHRWRAARSRRRRAWCGVEHGHVVPPGCSSFIGVRASHRAREVGEVGCERVGQARLGECGCRGACVRRSCGRPTRGRRCAARCRARGRHRRRSRRAVPSTASSVARSANAGPCVGECGRARCACPAARRRAPTCPSTRSRRRGPGRRRRAGTRCRSAMPTWSRLPQRRRRTPRRPRSRRGAAGATTL